MRENSSSGTNHQLPGTQDTGAEAADENDDADYSAFKYYSLIAVHRLPLFSSSVSAHNLHAPLSSLPAGIFLADRLIHHPRPDAD